jgi:hypothetical protein
VADPVTGPCAPWAIEADLTLCPCSGPEAADVLAHIPAVSDLLYRMSGHQYHGACTSTIRPAPVFGCGPVVVGSVEGWWVPDGIDATLAVNNLCGCSDDRRILRLPNGPVTAVTEVRIAGEVLDPAAYRVDDWQLLVRHDGGVWPDQHLEHPAGAEGTWTVTLTHGVAPPPSGVSAAVAWACEFAKACDPDLAGDCVIPEDARTVIRNGITYDLEPADLLSEGRTGIDAVDFFLHAVNPHQLHHGSSVRSPDLPAPVVTSWPTS